MSSIDSFLDKANILWMQLITIAHFGEAQSIIERLGLKKISDSLFRGERFSVLLTGEGPFEAASATALELGRNDYQEVINLGICGSLHPEYEVGTIHEVRSLYLAIDQKPQFRSFAVSEAGVDLLTSFERILIPEKASKLRGVAKLVDREAWGVAFACKEAGIKFSSFKLISDLAGSLGACELGRERAQEFSQRLAQFIEDHFLNQNKRVEADGSELGPEFYFTFTASHRLSSLLQRLSILREIPQAEILKNLPLEEIREKKISPKERGKLLLALLEDDIDPFRGKLKRSVSELKNLWEEKGIRLEFDPRFEDEKITFSFEAKSTRDLSEKLNDLKDFDFTPVEKIFKGDFDVE